METATEQAQPKKAPSRHSRQSLIFWNALATILSVPVVFTFFISGNIASGGEEYRSAQAAYGTGLAYLAFTLLCVAMSQFRRSLKWAVVALIIPVTFVVLGMIAPILFLIVMATIVHG